MALEVSSLLKDHASKHKWFEEEMKREDPKKGGKGYYDEAKD